MKYFKVFENESEYNSFTQTDEYVLPNISVLRNGEGIRMKPYIPPPPPPILLCDIAYWDGGSVKTISKDKWSSSLGTPVGVVVIPEGMLPDGKARIISLKGVNRFGDSSMSNNTIPWYGGSTIDASLTNYNRVPTTDNAGSTSSGSNGNGYLPSDNFTGATSYVDNKAKYNSTSNMIPSSYLGDDKTLNPEYCKAISGYNNALSDFNGLSNTETLVGLGSSYTAANAAYKYSDGSSNLQWYLPGMGELGFLMPRFNEINSVISSLGGLIIIIDNFSHFWSSSKYSGSNIYTLNSKKGFVSYDNSQFEQYVRPFALLG